MNRLSGFLEGLDCSTGNIESGDWTLLICSVLIAAQLPICEAVDRGLMARRGDPRECVSVLEALGLWNCPLRFSECAAIGICGTWCWKASLDGGSFLAPAGVWKIVFIGFSQCYNKFIFSSRRSSKRALRIQIPINVQSHYVINHGISPSGIYGWFPHLCWHGKNSSHAFLGQKLVQTTYISFPHIYHNLTCWVCSGSTFETTVRVFLL